MSRSVSPANPARPTSTGGSDGGASAGGSGGGDAWLSAWTPRGSDADDTAALAADTTAAASQLGVSTADVHILYAGTVESVPSIVIAAASCASCQGGSELTAPAVVMQVQGNSHVVLSSQAEAESLGPALGILPVSGTQGFWPFAILVGPSVASAQVRYTVGSSWQSIAIDNGVGVVASLPGVVGSTQVRLLAANGTTLATEPVPGLGTGTSGGGSFGGGFGGQAGTDPFGRSGRT